jgi:type II secretory pathway pseudopilin PulG
MPDHGKRLVTDESGITLVELLVYIVLLGAVMGIVVNLFSTSVRTEARIRSVSSDVRSAQLVSDSLVSGVRNSSGYKLSLPFGADQLLVARVANTQGETITWECRGWYYAAGNKTIRTALMPSPYTAPTWEPSSWTLLGTGVTPTPGNGDAVFTTTTTAAGQQLGFSFQFASSGNTPVGISNTVVGRAGPSGTPTCY